MPGHPQSRGQEEKFTQPWRACWLGAFIKVLQQACAKDLFRDRDEDNRDFLAISHDAGRTVSYPNINPFLAFRKEQHNLLINLSL